MTPRSALLADDRAAVWSLVARLLRGSFEIVGVVYDRKTALSTARALKTDLVFPDISLSGMGRIEVARELRRRGCPSKIVFLTVHENADIRTACLADSAMC
jgi:CheY-like chemotaxis protein